VQVGLIFSGPPQMMHQQNICPHPSSTVMGGCSALSRPCHGPGSGLEISFFPQKLTFQDLTPARLVPPPDAKVIFQDLTPPDVTPPDVTPPDVQKQPNQSLPYALMVKVFFVNFVPFCGK
jgi:hypothetical protein